VSSAVGWAKIDSADDGTRPELETRGEQIVELVLSLQALLHWYD